MEDMLRRVYIEITNQCNLHCGFCQKNHRPLQEMDPAFFEQVLLQVLKETSYIYLHVQGEPLLHSKFRAILSICEKHHARIALVTNGSLLHQYPDLLSFSCLHRVSVSMQSLPYQKKGSEIELMNTLIPMLEAASDAGHPYMELRFWRREDMNEPSLQYALQVLRERFPDQIERNEHSVRLLPGVFVSYDRAFSWPSLKEEASERTGTCLGARDQVAILSDGTVVPCCLDAEGVIQLGNLHDMTLDEILRGDRCRTIAEGFRRHLVVEPLCQKCSYRRRFSVQ